MMKNMTVLGQVFTRLFAVLLFISTSGVAQLKLTDTIPLAPEIRTGKLPNGLTYYIRKNEKPEDKVELRLVVKVGSIVEDEDQLGLAHFTEHMAFNGSKHFKKNELVSFLQSIGVEFGSDLNAQTGFDETIYILPIPVDKPDNLEKGFTVLEDWASGVSFDNKEIDKERGIVLEESRLGKGAGDRMNKVILPKLLEGSKYAERLPIGKDEVLKNFKYDVIKRFYNDWYRPDLMAVIAVGDIDPDTAEKMIVSHFSKLKNPVKERKRESALVPARTKAEGVVVTDPEATNHILQIYYSYKTAEKEITLGDYRASIVRTLFNSMLNLRLQELTQQAEPPFLFGASSIGGFVQGYEVFSSVTALGKPGIQPALKALMEENERARKFGFTAAELDRSKKSYLRSLERYYNERDKTESENYADEYIRNFVEGEPIPGIENEFNYFKEFSATISLEEINTYAKEIIPVNEPKLVILNGPEKSDFKMPTNQELLEMADLAEKGEVSAYSEKEVASSLMDKMPASGTVVSEKENKELGYTEITFSNHVKVILKPTDFKNDQVLMSAFRWGGQSLYDQADQYNAAYAATIVSQMGVKDLTPSDLRKILAGKTVNGSPRISQYNEGFGGQSGTADVEILLQLAYLYFTQPRSDEDLFNSFITRQQAALQNVMSNPETVYQDSVQQIVFQNHPRSPRIPSPEDLNKVKLERVMEIYQERMGNANGFTFIFVGSFDMANMKALSASYLGSLPSADVTPTFRDLGIRPVRGVVKKEVRKGTEDKSYITLLFTGEAPYSEEGNFRLQALMEALNIKLVEVLREDLSGVYGAGIRGQLNKNPYNHYSISLRMPCGPENVDKLIAASLDEILKVKASGPSTKDLNKVKETWLKQYREDLKDNSYWLAKLQQINEGVDPGKTLDGEKRINGLTVKDLKDTANKYFDMKNYVQVVLYPEK